MSTLSRENLTQEIGRAIFKGLESEEVKSFKRGWWNDQLMKVALEHENLKVDLFRFVDVLPTLSTSASVAEHIREYFCANGSELPRPLQWLIGGATSTGFTSKIVAGTVRGAVLSMANRFITGATPTEALAKLKKSHAKGLAFTLDLLGEAVLSESEASIYRERYESLSDVLSAETASWAPFRSEFSDFPLKNVSVKVSAFYSQINPVAFEESLNALQERLFPLFRKAKESGVFLNLDLEQYALKDLTYALFRSLREHPDLREFSDSGIVVQAYLKDSESDLRSLIQWGRREKIRFTVRLVKGAYWDYEVVTARQKDWPIPVYTEKEATDQNYERLTAILLENRDVVRTAIGSHNVRSIAYAVACATELGLPKAALEIQMLYGMADPIKQALVQMGYFVREYATVGELIPGMAYFVRRLLENTSNQGFLKKSFADEESAERLLKPPVPNGRLKSMALANSEELAAAGYISFSNHPLTDFGREEERARLKQALRSVRGSLPIRVAPIIAGKTQGGTVKFSRENPSSIHETVATIESADAGMMEAAIAASRKGMGEWAERAPSERAAILERAAGLVDSRKCELSALEILEQGKPWKEADADIAEGIDFLNYYASEIRRTAIPRKMGGLPGEQNRYQYRPKGIVAVISPWNFPLAIPIGQISAALAAGCPVLFKPAEQASAVGLRIVQILHEAGVPQAILHFLPGDGEKVGAALVAHPEVAVIAFTGSMAVGHSILNSAAQASRSGRFIKKVIAELGGKNAIIVDSDADLDEAVSGVLYSAFGYAGQKCSACSRAIILDEVYDRFAERLTDAAKSIFVRSAEDPSGFFGPVIDEASFNRLKSAIDRGRSEGKALVSGSAPSGGYFIGPHIFEGIALDSFLAQEEQFGPILCLFRVSDLDQALHLANGTRAALTGGFYSRSPSRIAKVEREFEVGNLYINRGCTGALVNRQPFGGFRQSGIGSKAGGPDYLLQFMDPVTITENTLRRGFSPETI